MTDTEVFSLSVYMLSVRQYMGDIMKEYGIVGFEEKADRQMINKMDTVIAAWSVGEKSSRLVAQELADLIPVAWNRKRKAKT
jgi:hypothetical protein